VKSAFVSDHLEKAADHLLLAVADDPRLAIDPVIVTEGPTPRRISPRRQFNREWTRYLVQCSRQFGGIEEQEW